MKAIIHTVNGLSIALEGKVVDDLASYFNKGGATTPLGWVAGERGNSMITINFTNVIYVEFKEVDTNA
jgi:hypothetical protein